MSRDKLLSPNYQDLEVWKDLADAIDYVFKDKIDNPQKLFFLLRDTFPYRYTEYGQETQSGLFDVDNLFEFAKEDYMSVNNMLGFQYTDTFFTRSDFQVISSNIASYYPDKVTPQFVNFFGYSLNAIFDAQNTWTEDYVTFYVEGDPTIGLPIYKGGTWYPTTHVRLTYDFIKFGLYTPYTVKNFFYYVAPINLVLDKIYYTSVIDIDPFNLAIAAEMTVNYT